MAGIRAAETGGSRRVRARVPGMRPGVRELSAQATRESILRAAIRIFAAHGYDGGRIEQISRAAKSHDRMIYYYFGSKEQLYVEVLEKLYGDIRNTETRMNLTALEPREAIRRLVEFTFDHHDQNVDFVRIVSIENIHNAEYVKQSTSIKAMNSNILEALGTTLRRGAELGLFREGLEPLDVHLLINSFSFYRVSNRHTFSEIFQIELSDEAVKQRHRAMICESVLRYLQA